MTAARVIRGALALALLVGGAALAHRYGGRDSSTVFERPAAAKTEVRAAPSADQLDVVWIVAHATGPAMEKLAREGTRFTDAHAAAVGARPFERSMLAGARNTELRPDATLLPRMLGARGIATAVYVDDAVRTREARIAMTRAREAAAFVRENAARRFFLYCHLGDERARSGAALGDAVGEIVKALDAAHLRDRTLILVTAGPGDSPTASRIPMLAVLPGVFPAGAVVPSRVRSIDLAPTVLELLEIEEPSRMSGASLLPLLRGDAGEASRVVVTEGNDSRAILVGRYRLVSGRRSEALYDIEADPESRQDLSRRLPDVVAEMRARLLAAENRVPVVGTDDASPAETAWIRMRFAGAGKVHRIAGRIRATSGTLRVEPAGIARESFTLEPAQVELAFETTADGVVGFDLRVEPHDADIGWEWYLDDRPWPADLVFAGPVGLKDTSLVHGIATDEARSAAGSSALPVIDAAHDLGLFVIRTKAPSRVATLPL